jgi:Glyoxalase-like domain
VNSSRAIDHLVIPAHDLAAQAECYRRLGFQVGARNRHPWGTENHIVQFDGAFLELLGLGDGFAPAAPEPGVYSFAEFITRYLDRREGLAMLVLRSTDAEADRLSFKAEGLGDFARFDFARKARRPDGSETDVAFSLAYAATPALAEAGFFVCQQRFPEHFWSRAAQIHPNGALGIVGLAIAHDEPESVCVFLERFLGAPARAVDGGFAFAAQGSLVECLAPRALSAQWGVGPSDFAARGLAGVRFAVADLAAARRLLDAAGVGYAKSEARLTIDPSHTVGALLSFEGV